MSDHRDFQMGKGSWINYNRESILQQHFKIGPSVDCEGINEGKSSGSLE